MASGNTAFSRPRGYQQEKAYDMWLEQQWSVELGRYQVTGTSAYKSTRPIQKLLIHKQVEGQ